MNKEENYKIIEDSKNKSEKILKILLTEKIEKDKEEEKKKASN